MVDQHRLVYPRHLECAVKTAMTDTRVVLISGPRQAGKTTLAKKLTNKTRSYVTLDDTNMYQAARSDPVSFIRQFDYVTIDEIQRVPDLIREIKISVDEDQRSGRFLLTGSADILTIPTVSESLAGRMAICELLPLSQAEIEQHKDNPLDRLFKSPVSSFSIAPFEVSDIDERVLIGGYPEMVLRRKEVRRRAWADDYIRTLLSRDVREIMDAHNLKDVTKLLEASAIQSAQLIIYSHIANDLQISVPTAQRYLKTMEQIYLIRFLPAWHRNKLKRLVRTPKLHFLDSGLLAAISKVTSHRLRNDRSLLGSLFETFVYSELLKHSLRSDYQYDFYHYRDKDKVEVDLVIEESSDNLIGIEVKASASVRQDDFKGLKRLKSVTGKAFQRGCVFYFGEKVLSFGDRLQAFPASMLWSFR